HIRSLRRPDANAVAVGAPRFYALVEAKRRSGTRGDIEMRRVARLGIEIARAWIEHRDIICAESKCRIAPGDFVGSHLHDRNGELPRAPQRAAHDLAVARTDHQTAYLVQQTLSRSLLELAP